MARRILLVDDEPGLRTTLSDRIRVEGYQVDTAADSVEGKQKATSEAFDLILLDVMLPGQSGFDLCKDLRRKGINTPVLMLTARTGVADKVQGLKLGADDYLTKPFETAELLARIEALMRRSPQTPPATAVIHEFGNMTVDLRRAEVSREGQKLSLSGKEFHLLRYLLEHRGEVISREELLKEVWGYHAATASRTVDVHVAWLRQKLESNPKTPQWIETVVGVGYRFSDKE